MLASCNDFLTGQDGEPHGALKVTKLTLNDSGLNKGSKVVTDTSVPADCMADAVKNLPKCNADPFGDTYGVLRSPPNPDSARILRVVFNKAPLNLAGATLEPVPDVGLPSAAMPLKLSDPSVIKLTCENCSTDGVNQGVPPSYNSLQLTGTDLSPDPSQYAYGPGLQMEVIATCPKKTDLPAAPTKCQLAGPTYVSDAFRALEPGAKYTVVLNPLLQGRLADGTDTVQLDDSAKALLTFTTAPFAPVQLGNGQGILKDADKVLIPGSNYYLDGADKLLGDGSATAPYVVGKLVTTTDAATGMDTKSVTPTLDNAGAVVLKLNAPADEQKFTPQTVSASVTVNGGAAMPVAVKISTATFIGMPRSCVYGNRRSLYIAPISGMWLPMTQAGGVVTITIRGNEVRDLSQLPGHPGQKGIHALGRDITIQAQILATSADPAVYGGVYSTDLPPPMGC